MLNKITSIVIALLAIALLYMGIKLLMVGGSPAYFLIALVLLATAGLLFLQKKIALTVYAFLMWAILIWIVAEVGLDKWQWIPRGALFALIGFWLAMPFVVKPLYKAAATTPESERQKFHPFLGGTVGVMILMVIALLFYDPVREKGNIENPAEATDAAVADQDWTAYGGNSDALRYSKLAQINSKNVKNLKVAWEYHTGDLRDSKIDASEYTFEATPLKVNDTLYLCTAHNQIHALIPETGQLKWKYIPQREGSYLQQHQTCRGVSYFDIKAVKASANNVSPATAAPQECSKRIITTTATAPKLIALDADTGKLCSSFGDNGEVDLTKNMGKILPHVYMQTAVPLVANNLIIIGGSVMDNGYNSGNPSGVIRAYDAITGQLVWNFDPANPELTQPLAEGQQYPYDTTVAWSTFTADIKNGLVYVPFGNASPDLLGLDRDPASNSEKFRDALVALDLNTGKLKWSFQTSYHDLWDRDNPAQPSLLDIDYKGQKSPAIILPTKVGNIFVLNRLTGKPIYPIEQVKVSTQGDIGEKYAPTQPKSSLNFIPEMLTEASMWGITPFDQIQCRIDFNKNRYDGNPWTPSTEKGSIIFPGNIGVFNWGSVSIDPERQILIGSPVRLAYLYKLIKRTPETEEKRLFTQANTPYWNENFEGHYATQIKQFASNLGIPCIAPPWGRLAAVNLKTGKTEWIRRVGNTKNLKTTFLPGRFPIGFNMGMLAHGGTLTTKGGIVFQAATADNFFRAYEINTGKKLWQTELPAGGQATPATFMGKDKTQYVVLAAGGHGSLGTQLGDSMIAYKVK
ncbi:membrane-bound PQQ-dependent dehydrogenase, glucose/quinate/shikimate family [Acinetobacter sp. ANC 4779]|uniref:membrane-bound PQQ-dependent dehydrogenase, glucose/quinate/shikimate family n=1 Tax=Acinetobacter sp. ANC 4779 TaxID=2529848 RepID=UPI00103F48B9|nr:membrane-bound PQQ-dependent dehydrogenase, glucose/quinate/shikimate family [Acinetobacter sp. ANC 4779]TCB50165.1 membrane-bound PQQ-dependent dehydrogenase, glucose/quinate/shikimate family [Acinetobacter sp. ANC 4779]